MPILLVVQRKRHTKKVNKNAHFHFVTKLANNPTSFLPRLSRARRSRPHYP
jgi:hypothetical protein